MKYQQVFTMQKSKLILILVALLLFLEITIFASDNLQNKFTILGLKLDNKNLTNLSRMQIEEIVKKEAEKSGPLQLSYQDKIFAINPQEIGVKVDIKQFTNQLVEKGRTGIFWQKIIDQDKAFLGLNNQKLTGSISQTLLNLKILELQNEVNKQAQPIMPDFIGDISKTIPAQDGVKINTSKLTVLIVDNIFNPPKQPIPLPVIKTFTTHKEDELEPIRKQLPNLIKQPISISSGGLNFTLTKEELRSISTVVERPDPKNPKKLMLVLRLDDTKLNQKLGQFAQKVASITHAEFDDHDARVAIYGQFYSGKRYLAAIPTGRALAANIVLGAQTTGGEKKVYLTFDDGPNSIYHPMVLDILKTYNIKATFFLVGQSAQRDAETAKRTALEGHKIGNHSNSHSFLPKLSTNSILNELQQASLTLKSFNSNQDIEIFRPPYGGVNLSVKQYADRLNMRLYLWDVDPRDWSEPETGELVNRVVSNVFNGADILFHSNHLATVKALPKIIEALKGQGYSFETLTK